MNKERTVIILSGGLDSTTLLYDIVYQGFEVFPISFNYNQKHKRELECAKATCQKLHLEHKIVDLSILNDLAPSALTRDDWKVPEGYYTDENMKQTVVPNRNMVMLSLATAYAIGIGARKLFYGAHSGDHTIYPDCRPEFIKALSEAIALADWQPIQLLAPYSNIDKGDIVKRGLELGVDYSLTHTCYAGEEVACGVCGACQERLEAFEKAGFQDPIKYRGK